MLAAMNLAAALASAGEMVSSDCPCTRFPLGGTSRVMILISGLVFVVMATTLVEIAGMRKIALSLMASKFKDERGGEIHRRRRRERRGLESEISDLESSLRPLCA